MVWCPDFSLELHCTVAMITYPSIVVEMKPRVNSVILENHLPKIRYLSLEKSNSSSKIRD